MIESVGHRIRLTNQSRYLLAEPDPTAATVSEILYGETATVMDQEDHFVRLRADRDGYEGWLIRDCIAQFDEAATHLVSARSAPVFITDSVKAPIVRILPLMSAVTVRQQTPEWSFLHNGSVVSTRHIQPIGWHLADAAQVAINFFMGAPYVWGGKSPHGTDCSGLVQSAYFLTGVKLPRDSGPQQAYLTPVEGRPRRGMIAGFKRHVGLMVDETNIIHANAQTMDVAIEPVADVIDRVKRMDGPNVFNGFFKVPDATE